MVRTEHLSGPDAGPPSLDPGAMDAEARRRLSGPGLRTFLHIAELWGLSERDRRCVLGWPGRSTYHGWLAKARAREPITLSLDTLLRLSAMLGIHKALRIIFPREADALAWLRAPNAAPLFGGQTPLSLVTSGTQDGLLMVRRYLDAWRGGGFTAPNPRVDSGATPMDDDDIVFV
jgi:hypothetical protein